MVCAKVKCQLSKGSGRASSTSYFSVFLCMNQVSASPLTGSLADSALSASVFLLHVLKCVFYDW